MDRSRATEDRRPSGRQGNDGGLGVRGRGPSPEWGIVRGARVAVLLLACVALFGAAMSAEAEPFLVSNTGQEASDFRIALGDTGSDKLHSQGFTTGPNTGGYRIESVGVHVNNTSLEAGETMTVLVYTRISGTFGPNVLGTLVLTLTSPSSYTAGAVNKFTAPSGARLAPSTDYLVVFSGTGDQGSDFELSLTDSIAEDPGAAHGWSIENAKRYNGNLAGVNSMFMIEVESSPVLIPADWSLKPDAVGSTEAVNVRRNTLTRAVDTDAPIYWVSTTATRSAVADGYADFYATAGATSVAWGDVGLKTETGASTTMPEADSVHTGSNLDGTTSSFSPLGGRFGLTWVEDWYLSGVSEIQAFIGGTTDERRLLALSPLFQVASDTTSADATLSALALSGGTLDPTFVSTTEVYTATVVNSVMQTTVVATPTHSGATVDFKDGDDNTLGTLVPLAEGANVIKVVVTAENRTTMKTYMVTVTRGDPTVPGAPRALTATADGANQIDLTWKGPVDNGGRPVTGWRIEVSADGTSDWTDLVANTFVFVPYAHTGLSAGTTRYYRVSAINSVGTGAASDTASATTDEAVLTKPGAPTGLTATANGATRIDLSWTAPADNGGTAITGYQVEFSTNGSSDWFDLNYDPIAPDRTTYAHTVPAGTTRYYRVSAINSVGTGTASDTASATTDDVDLTVPGAPTNVTATASGSTRIDLSWTAPAYDGGSPITDYVIRVSPNGSSWINRWTGTTATSYSDIGLYAGEDYYYAVSAINANGTGAESDIASATTHALEQTLVSNTGQDVEAQVIVGSTSRWVQAQGFTTGDDPSGYTLSSVEVHTGFFGEDEARVSIYGTDALGNPGSSLYVLANPTFIPATAQVRSFTAPATARLAQETSYFVVVEAPALDGQFAVQQTNSDAEDSGTASCWSIHDTGSIKNPVTAWTTRGASLMIAVKGTGDYGTILCADATLTDLALTDNNGAGITLNEVFASDLLTYTASVASTVVQVTVMPTLSDANATIEYLDGDGAALTDADTGTDGFQVDMDPGDNVIGVKVTAAGGASGLYTLTVTPATTTNTAPVFDDNDPTSRSVAENTVSGQPVGAPVGASDAENDTLTYTLGGTDAGSFVIDDDTGQLRTSAALDHETRASYNVTVTAADGYVGGTDTIAVTANVTDVAEKPATPDQPTVRATVNTTRSLDVSWTKPALNGGPEIVGYRLQYEVAGSDSWTETTPPGTGTMATIGSLDEDTEYAVQVRARNGETPSDWSASGQGRTGAGTNTDPTFDETDPSRSVAENTASLTDFGLPVTATDDEPLEYTLEGPDAGSFDIGRTTGQLRTVVVLDHEAKARYTLTVKADDGHGGTATIDVAVNVNDVAEKPATPAQPMVSATANTTDSVTVSWTKPGLNGGPDIAGYRLRHRVRGAGSWNETTPPGTGTTATIGTLAEDTEYAVQVRALNGETPSDWSASGTGRTGAGSNTAPEFDAGLSTTREVAENTPSGQLFGDAVSADDPDGDSLKYTLEGADAASFRIGRTTGRLRTSAALDHEAKPSHTLTVEADDERGGTATIVVTVDVADVDEPPSAPGAPTVSAVEGSATSLSVRWSAPANTGPPVTDYDLRHRKTGGNWMTVPHNGAGRTATIGGLDRDTEYEVQVLARNDEGDSGWSPSGRGIAGQAARSVHMEDVTVHEGETARFTIVFSPAGSDDPLLWETHDVRARAGEDFARTSRGIALQAGVTEVTGEVEIYADDEAEDEERFQIAIAFGDVGDTVEYWGSIYIRDGEANGAPVFADDAPTTRKVAENTAANRPVGKPVTAEDPNDDPVTYTLEGADAASFGIDRTTGQLRTSAALDHEAKASYTLRVKADDDHGGTARIVVTVNVEDVAEKPATPAAPGVSATANATDSLDVSWTEPDLAGGPDIVGYRLRRGVRGGSGWFETTTRYPATARSAAIDGLAEDTEYDVRVRALNGEDTSDWSPPGFGRAGANAAPTFDEGARTARDVAENTASGQAVGAAISADDPEDGELTYTLEGPDAGSFGIDSRTGQLRTSAALDHEAKASHALTVKADDGEGGTATIAVTVNVEDVAEKPATPAAPTVTATANATDSVDVSWTKPGLDGGPDIVGYKLQYEVSGSGSWTETTPSGTGTTASIGTLAEDTEYAVRVRALNGETPSDWSPSGSGRTGGGSNTAPEFADGTSTTREVAENTASGQPVGGVVSADDADDDPLTYTLEGTDAASFGIDRTTGQLRTSAALDHEAKASYTLTVKADDERGGTATIVVTVNVEDVAEKPATPVAPGVSATANATDSLDVAWRKPGLDGGPDIVGYKLQYEVSGSGSWTETTPSGTGTTATIGTLAEDTEYAVRVRALNGETPSDWSPSGSGRTGAGSNTAPEFDTKLSTTREVAENTVSGQPVGAAVSADDADDDPLTYTLEGADAASFGIDRTTGQLRTSAALDHESDPSYQFTVKADDERGGTATIVVTVNVTDVDEPPQAPGAPTVSPESGSATSLSVRWSAPANAGPPVTEYDLRYREAGGSWPDSPTTKNIAGRTASIGELVADTEYQVQVLARNDEGESGWSAWGRGRTNADDGPSELAVLTIHALASSVPVDGVARFELRRSGGDMGWLKVGYWTDESDGNHVRSWGYFRPGRASKGADFHPTVSGTVTARLTGPPDPLCTPDDAPSASCTDDYRIGSPSSASMRVTAASSSPLSARVVGDLLTLRYADPLDAGSTPGPKDWVVRAATDVGSRTLAVTGVSVSGAEVALALSPAGGGGRVGGGELPAVGDAPAARAGGRRSGDR